MLICNDCTNPAADNSFLCAECTGSESTGDCTCDDEMCDNCKKFQQLNINVFNQQEG